LNYKVLLFIKTQHLITMSKYFPILKNWFGYSAVITLLCGIIYIVAQQNFRMSANDPQYQMAEDAANALDKGADPKSLINPSAPVEISQSLSPYLVIYSTSGNMAASGATLDGKALTIPKGVIDYVNKNGKDAASWQPQPGVRQAMVGIRAKNYIAFSGRSLRKVEERIATLGEQVLFGWAMSIAAMLLVAVLQDVVAKRWEQQVA